MDSPIPPEGRRILSRIGFNSENRIEGSNGRIGHLHYLPQRPSLETLCNMLRHDIEAQEHSIFLLGYTFEKSWRALASRGADQSRDFHVVDYLNPNTGQRVKKDAVLRSGDIDRTIMDLTRSSKLVHLAENCQGQMLQENRYTPIGSDSPYTDFQRIHTTQMIIEDQVCGHYGKVVLIKNPCVSVLINELKKRHVRAPSKYAPMIQYFNSETPLIARLEPIPSPKAKQLSFL
jgi:hypothetical protein